jgi:hypothetical protein
MNSNSPAARPENTALDSLEDPVEEPSVEKILLYLEWLMGWYCREPSMLLATMIAARLEWLQELQAGGEIALPEWSRSRLIRNWKYLAEHCRRT